MRGDAEVWRALAACFLATFAAYFVFYAGRAQWRAHRSKPKSSK